MRCIGRHPPPLHCPLDRGLGPQTAYCRFLGLEVCDCPHTYQLGFATVGKSLSGKSSRPFCDCYSTGLWVREAGQPGVAILALIGLRARHKRRI